MNDDIFWAAPIAALVFFLALIVLSPVPKPPFGDTIHIIDNIKAYKNALGNQYFVK